MLGTALGDPVEHRVGAHRPSQVALDRGPLQVSEVTALEEAHEVGRGVSRAAIDQLHLCARDRELEGDRVEAT